MTNNQRLAGEARAMQKVARHHLQSIRGAGSAAVHLGGDATPDTQRALLAALDALPGAVVEAFDE